MLQAFLAYIKQEKLIPKQHRILLAVSGGIDSVVLCHLFAKANLNFGIAHCNFQLRGEESEADELFVEALAEKYNVPFHSTSFDTTSFAKKNKLSIQVAARQLRYNWFETIRTQFDYTAIATAHHSNDSIETFFIKSHSWNWHRRITWHFAQTRRIDPPLIVCKQRKHPHIR